MNKIFILDAYCYLRQYADLNHKVSGIKEVKVNKIFEKKIQVMVTFTLDDNANASRCCFYLSKGKAPSDRWLNCGDIILPNGQEATMYVGLSEY